MIADIKTNGRFQAIIKELFIRCRKLNISHVFTTQSYFSVPKDVSLTSIHYLIMKINNRRDILQLIILQTLTITILWKFTKNAQKNLFNFLTIDTTSPARNPLRFRKNSFDSYKNDSNWSDKILNRKIIQNEAQHELDTKAAKISALSSNNLNKYEYLIVEDLGLKPSNIEQAKFEYSPLGKIFNRGLDEDDKKRRIV